MRREKKINFCFTSGCLENFPQAPRSAVGLFMQDQNLFAKKLLGQVSKEELAAEKWRILRCLDLAGMIQQQCEQPEKICSWGGSSKRNMADRKAVGLELSVAIRQLLFLLYYILFDWMSLLGSLCGLEILGYAPCLLVFARTKQHVTPLWCIAVLSGRQEPSSNEVSRVCFQAVQLVMSLKSDHGGLQIGNMIFLLEYSFSSI